MLLFYEERMIKVSGTPPCVVGSNLKTESKCFVFASIPSKTLHLEKNYENRKSDWKLFPELPQRSTTSLKHGSDGSALPPIKSRVSDNSQLSQITQFSNWYVQLRISPHSGNLLNQTLIKTRVDSNKGKVHGKKSKKKLTSVSFAFTHTYTLEKMLVLEKGSHDLKVLAMLD